MEKQEEQEPPSAAFIKENDLKGPGLIAGKTFERSFTLKNDGDCDWPLDTVLTQRLDKSDRNLSTVTVRSDDAEGCVQPDQEATFKVMCLAPNEEGIFKATFTLRSRQHEFFGQPAIIFIQVPKPEEH